MSYSILIYKNGNEMPREIPFETNEVFKKYFLPIFEKYEFEILPEIEYGYDLPLEDFDLLIKELETFKQKINSENEFIIRRLNFILEEFKKTSLDEVNEIYLG